MSRKGQRKLSAAFDPGFRFLLNLDPALESWQMLAAEYWEAHPRPTTATQSALTAFLVAYVHGHGLQHLSTEQFFARKTKLPEPDTALRLAFLREENAKKKHDNVSDFLDWVLREKLSVIESDGHRVVPPSLANPFVRKAAKVVGKMTDLSFSHVLRLDPRLEDWRGLAAEWMKDQRSGVDSRRDAIGRFLIHYIYGQDLERNFGRFLLRETEKPDFSQLLVSTKSKGEKALRWRDIDINNICAEFLDWVLTVKLGDPETGAWDTSRFHNPIQRIKRSNLFRNSQSDKASLSIRYIRELRAMLAEGRNFRDWAWAQQALEDGRGSSEWFVVDPKIIDHNDPDCVARHRASTKYEMKFKGYPTEVWEMWSPVRALALYIKLELPLRTFQVRMLDSGEADTWRYVHGSGGGRFIRNSGPLAIGSEKSPYQRGVFHRSANENEAGLYVNTNKTADINKAENEKGYVIPWSHHEALYWLEKLRNWQERYNSISAPTPWNELEQRHFNATPPHPEVLAQRGSACFLFRDPTYGNGEKPLDDWSMTPLWYKLLAKLEMKCAARGETLDDGTPMRFVRADSGKVTLFPLHALRVSLISYFILDLRLPIAVVSKMIAGHANIIMTLYYTKFGKAYMREVLSEAEKNELEAEQSNHRRFLNNATFEQVCERFAYVSDDAVRATLQSSSAAAFVFDDKGICPNGGTLCDVGGEKLSESKGIYDYPPVPGFPQERNCASCRFFLTGPAFLPGLIAHFNALSEKIHRQSERYSALQEKLTYLEDMQREAERDDKPFLQARELDQTNKYAEAEALTLNKYMNDLQATNLLIQRSIKIAEDATRDGVKLIAKGSMEDLKVGFIESQSVLHQLEVVCENAVIYPEIDAGFATIRRSQMLDAMLRYNGMDPILMYLDQNEQLLVGNAVMRLIQARTGSIKDSLPYAECRIKFNEIGLLKDQVMNEIAEIKAKVLIDHAKAKRTLAQSKEYSHDDAP